MILITFSGLDGCGKSTHVRLTCAALARRGYRVYRLVTLFTSLTGAWTLLREARQRRHNRAPQASAALPITNHRRVTRKNGADFAADRGSGGARLRRWIAYPLDCLALSAWLLVVRLRGYSAVVCDRYIYDKMVNLPHPQGVLSRLLRVLTPVPDCAIFLDVPPEIAATRRPEHDGEYFTLKYVAYKKIVASGVGLRAIAAGSKSEVQNLITAMIEGNVPRRRCPDPEAELVQANVERR